ncbi:MAG: nicotinate-nucleotide--dimethylbenzimidazole phosphoribosyltransferase [Deltaproteobacteria bacterium]|nr:MAG: nicotinate-nucleotide--dimethylbenzimidazole phosphoribosyltransferase [Deltaproteobacteria bacterium]
MEKISKIIKEIKGIDRAREEKAQQRLDLLTKPKGSLGRLEELAKKVVGITGVEKPKINQKAIIVMAGDHGVVEERVSAFPQEVTSQMVLNFINGGAGINVLARHVGARVVVVDMGVKTEPRIQNEKRQNFKNKKISYGTKNIAKGPAMTRNQAIDAIYAGIEVLEAEIRRGLDIVGTGEMGIGNTTVSSTIVAAITGKPVPMVTGWGTGIDEKTFQNKIKIIEKALAINKPNPSDPIDVLAKVGGFEIGGLVGVILAGAKARIPVVIDGFISSAAALVAFTLEPKIRYYLIASHLSVEAGHRILLEKIGLTPLFDFGMRLGEGTGAALGISIVEAAVKILTEMTSFEEAGVSRKVN